MTLESSFVEWLLAATTPTVRTLTLTELLQHPADAPQVRAAQQATMSTGPVPEILAAQTDAGHWPNEHSYYTPKYISTHWSLLLLTELGVDGTDARFRRGVEFMLADTSARIERNLGARRLDIACLWGNVLRYALHAGTADDPRTARIVELLVQSLNNGGCRCEYNRGLGCGWGVARALWGLAALPVAVRTPAVAGALDRGVDFLLNQFSLAAADYPVPEDGKIHPLWFRLNFPLFYQVDILFALRVLADLDALDHPGASDALDWLSQRQRRNGHWQGRSPYGSRTWRCLGDRAETDRWVSLQAARVLQQAGRL